jgi:hypothetical protein
MAIGETMARLDYFKGITEIKPRRRQVKTTALVFNYQLHKVQDYLSTERSGYEIGQTIAF